MGYTLDDLEKKFALPKDLVNSIEVENYGKRVVYEGKFYGINFDGQSSMSSSVSLIKKEIDKKPVEKYRSLSGSNVSDKRSITTPIKNIIEEEQTAEIWKFQTDTSIISEGQIISRRYGYRNNIIASAARKGVALSDALMREVFDPLESQLLSVYRNLITELGSDFIKIEKL